MHNDSLARGSKKLIEHCLAIKPGENVLILTDTQRDYSIASSLAHAAAQAGAEPCVMVMRSQTRAGMEPPLIVREAMAAADVVITPTTRAVYHTDAVQTALRAGTRLLTLSEARPETLISGLIDCDFLAQKPLVEKLAKLMTAASEIRVTTELGTDITASLRGRRATANTAICHNPGQGMGAALEAYIAPVEDSSEGSVHCDLSASMLGILEEPIVLRFEKGRAVSIEGGSQASRLQEILSDVRDPLAFTLAEIAFGMNPCANITGDIIQDEGKYGTAHIALGGNKSLSGACDVPVHIDLVFNRPSAWLDGVQVFSDGEFILGL